MSRWTVLGFSLLVACGSSAPPPSVPSNRSAPLAVSEGVQYVGNPSASVAITYYFDYLCPHCYASAPQLEEVVRTYGDRIVIHYKNFQMKQHPDARLAAITAEAARRQSRFIEMHRALMKHAAAAAGDMNDVLTKGPAPTFTPEVLRDLATKIGLDLAQYDRDIADPSAGERVDAEYAEGEKQGVEYVPVLYFGTTRFEGRMDSAEVSAAIDAKLTP